MNFSSKQCGSRVCHKVGIKGHNIFHSLAQTFKMLKMAQVLLICCLVGATNALYKQWIPDTNYENKTNWDKGEVPCGSDTVQFSSQRKVSVFVETTHAIQEMILPMEGEIILNSGAGFYVISGQDPDCGAGVRTKFKDADSLQWFNPALWQAAATLTDLQDGHFLFSVHEESVPCLQDDVVFKPLSSFRVDTSSSQTTIPVKSVSVLGKVFDSKSEFSEYLSSQTGLLQFHGSSSVTVGNPSCGDATGCDCGNSVNHDRICSTVTCGALSCKKHLLPIGHCCKVCGAILVIHYSDNFNLENYRGRIRHLFLSLLKYQSIQLGMSKILKPQRLMRIIPFGFSPEIQVVILDGETGKLSEELAQDMIKDIKSHGLNLGITGAEIQTASEPGSNVGTIVGAVFGVLLVVTLIVIVIVLIHKGIVQMPSMPPMPSMPSLSRFRRNTDVDDLNGAADRGFDNPIFDQPDMLNNISDLYSTDSISMTQTGVHFINPAYDENETDFTV